MKWTIPGISRLRAAVERGETDDEIAAAIGATPRAIQEARTKHKIRRPPRKAPRTIKPEDLRAAVDRGETDEQIAASVGSTAATIRRERSRRGIKRARTYSAKMTREDLVAAVERGDTDAQIAAANGMTKGGVTQARRRWGIPAAVRPPRIDDAIVVAMIRDGASDTDIARRLSCSDQTIRTRRAKLAIVRDGVTLPRGRAAPIPPHKRDLIRAAAAHGWTRNQMLRQFKIGPKRLKRILEQA